MKRQTPITPELVRAALSHIPANLPRGEWAKVGMAIKSEYPDDVGRGIFETWSTTAEGYDANAAASTWRSIKVRGGVTIASLLYLAKQHGFELPKPDKLPAVPSAAEQARRAAAQKQAAQLEAERQQTAHAAAAEAACTLWEAASPTGTSPYLARKGVQAHGLRFMPDGTVLVPLRDADGVLWNVQRIIPERLAGGTDKLFQKGARKTGLWHMLGEPGEAPAMVLVGEGYATCASLHEAGRAAGGWPVAVAFDAGNLAHVARALRQRYRGALLVLCGDDDRATEARTGTNPGRVKALSAARAVAGVTVFPVGLEGDASDFNDMHQAQGLDAVRAVVQAAIDATATRQPPADARQASQWAGNGAAGADEAAARRSPFTVEDGGVYYHGTDKNGDPASPLWVCSRLDVVARTRDQDENGWGYLLQFADPLGRAKQWAMPARMLSGDGGEYRAMLLHMGLRLSTSPMARNRLTEYLQRSNPEEFARCTDRIGWHPTASGAAYVLPHRTIGGDAERIVFQSDNAMENTFRVRKDAAAWRDRVGTLCAGNSRLIFAVSCAFAGPLLRLAGIESGGFHLRGDSSSGKTTALRVAASVNGGPSYMQRWRATDNALEAIAAQHCDALLILDELAQVDGRVAGECAYMLANEQSKARATRGGAPRARLSWRLLFLSAGELGLADHMATAQKHARTGQEVRMVDIPADAGAGMGAFEDIHDRATPAAFAAHLGREVPAVHGAPGVAFIEWVATHWDSLAKRLRDGVRTIVDGWVPASASGQVQRVASRFALVAMAGELATEVGLTGWDASECEWAAHACFEAWVASRGGMGNGEVLAMLRQVRRFLEAHGESRFTWWHRGADDHNAKTLQRAGYRRMLNQDGEPVKTNGDHAIEYGERMPAALGEGVTTEFFILPEAFRTEVCQGFTPDAVARTLLEHECLIAEEGRYTVKTRLPGMAGTTRCYRIPPKIFEIEI